MIGKTISHYEILEKHGVGLPEKLSRYRKPT